MNGKLFTKLFWKDATERMVVTFAQVFLSISGVFLPGVAVTNQRDLETTIGLVTATLPLILLASVGGAVLSLLKAIVAAYTAGTDTASLAVDTKPLTKERKLK